MDEADEHPPCDQKCLGLGDGVEEGDVWPVGLGGLGMMAGDGVIGEASQPVHVSIQRGVLERPDAEVARRDPGENGAAWTPSWTTCPPVVTTARARWWGFPGRASPR